MVKELGPIEKLTKDADAMRKQVDRIVKESNKNAGNKKLKDKELKLKENFKSLYELKPQVTELLQRAEGLTEEGEPSKVKNFEPKKNNQILRIQSWQNQLQDAMSKVLPGEEGEAYTKELKKAAGGEEEEEEDEEVEEEEVEEEETEEEDDEEEEGETEKKKTEEEDEDDDEEEEEDEEETLETPKAKKEVAKLDLKKKSASKKVEEEEDDDDEEDEDEDEDEEEVEEETHKKTPATASKKKVHEEEEEDDEEEEEEDEDEEEETDEDEDEDEEDSEEEEEEEEDEKEVTTTGRLFEALYDYTGQEKDDLSFKKGDILTIINTREDGWWEAENEKGDKGNVPSTYLQMYNKYKDLQKDDEEEEDEDEEEEDDKEEGDEETEEKHKKVKRTRSGKALWKGIKKAVQETSVTDVLHAMGAVPSGFRLSTLGQKFNTDPQYTMKNYLSPKLSNSNFSYKDLFFDPSTNKIRSRLSKEQRIITLANCRQIPVPAAGLEVRSRHVRICLFDGQNILSNIHTVKVATVDRDQRTWSFNTRVSDIMDTYQHAEVFVRTNHVVNNIGILFELCCTYQRTSTNETGEFSCGWVHLPFVDDTGLPLQNKSFDLYVNGGTPYEKGVEVDPSISRRTSSNAFMSLISGNKQPRLTVKVSIPKREQKELLDTLPDTLLGNTVLLQMYSYYRQILADTLLRDRLDLESTELIHSPTLTTFPAIADQHDLMKLLRDSWVERVRGIRRAEMRDAEYMKDQFKQAVMESVYPIHHSASLPAYNSGDFKSEETRAQVIQNFRQQKVARRGILALLLSTDMSFKPFDMKEVSYSVIGPYCLQHNTQVPQAVES